jgi:hypothetical protein
MESHFKVPEPFEKFKRNIPEKPKSLNVLESIQKLANEKELHDIKKILKEDDVKMFQKTVSSINKCIKSIEKSTALDSKQDDPRLNKLNGTNWNDFKNDFNKRFTETKEVLKCFISSKDVNNARALYIRFIEISDEMSNTLEKVKLMDSHISAIEKCRKLIPLVSRDYRMLESKLGEIETHNRIGLTHDQLIIKADYIKQLNEAAISAKDQRSKQFAMRDFLKHTEDISNISERISQEKRLLENTQE